MPTLRLTDRTIRSLKAGSRAEYFDSSLPGFGVRVNPTGRKAFVLRYRTAAREHRMTLGTFPALSLATARTRAKVLLGEIAKGGDPAAALAKRKLAGTFAELAALYMERHAKLNKRSWKLDQRMLDRDLLPDWKHRKANEIRRADVTRVLDEIVDRGAPYAANRVRALVSTVFAFGIKRGVVELNPVAGVPRPAPPRSRDRVLTEDEIRRLWAALDAETPLMAAHFRLRLLTAQRGIEVLSMRHEDIDGDWWTIPAGVAKNKLAHRVPLSPPARAVLDAIRPLADGSTWVFPAANDGHLRWVNKAAGDIRGRLGFDWKAHDLRRTAATYMTSMGIPRLVVAKLLNHAEPGVTAVYDRSSYDLEKRAALERWSARLEAIVAEPVGAERAPIRLAR